MTSPAGAHPLLAEIERQISATETDGRRDQLSALAHALLRRTNVDQLADLPVEELLQQVVQVFEMVDARREPVAVRVVDSPPTGSAVEVNTADAPFLVDTLREAITAEGYTIRLLLHPVVGVVRDAEGRVLQITDARGASTRESIMRIELEQHLSPEKADALRAVASQALSDLRMAVADFRPMVDSIGRMIDAAQGASAHYGEDEVDESVLFLEWLRDQHFVLLGVRDYAILPGPEGSSLMAVQGSGLGILRDADRTRFTQPVPLRDLPQAFVDRLTGGDLVIISKTIQTATVHRRARMDDITVKKVGHDGAVTGEIRLLGLFTSLVYMEQAARTPLLRRKLRRIVKTEDLIEGSHDYKAAVSIFESFPRDELFAASWEELRERVMAVLGAEESKRVTLNVRLDPAGRNVSVLIAMARDRFNAELRQRLQALLLDRYSGQSVEYHLSLAEGDLAQLFFTVHVGDGGIPEVAYEQLEAAVVAACRSWDDELADALVARFGRARGDALAHYYARRFPDYYKTATDVDLALLDVEQLEAVRAGAPFSIALQNESLRNTQEGAEPLTRLTLVRFGGKVPIGRFLPVLENLGLTVIEEVPTRLDGPEDDEAYLHDFGVLLDDGLVDLERSAGLIAEAASAAWRGDSESDSLNRLVVRADLDWHDVVVLRAYRRYRQVVSPSFTESYQNDVLVRQAETTRLIVELFRLRFGGDEPAAPEKLDDVRAQIQARLEQIQSLDEDRILRGFLGLIEATERTNVYVPDRGTQLSFKLRSERVPQMPRPFPLHEIFVYSTEMEGIHLRGGSISRGGIRWSDRREDYRTEVLGLMKAQMVKNAVIVPVGSKGGFVLRHPPDDRAALKAEVERQYTALISGMLDVTDNIVGGQVVHPPGVRIYDDDDTYLVVAADKGTATLSDLANGIAGSYGFWLGDAFASGGSHGYDHKALGITARGAWESVKRHFRELGHDVMSRPFTVAGVGDMSGDVFGNGTLLSDQIRLVAAFDHRHVFLDPDPDPAVSFAERQRLFLLGAGTSWADYDASLISPGGGVFARTLKSIPISPAVRAALGIEAEALTPNELLQAILRAPVDLFWNGGIGTFVKASSESNGDVGDRTNDAIRVDANELRARVVGEGGNLGLTQLARIEYAQAGGRMNTDAIDNSAGVDCSDHEVNIKILLGLAIERGVVAPEQRDELLASLAGAVCEKVLYDNYLQVQILSQEEAATVERSEDHEALMRELEAEGLLDRRIEFLPSTEALAERRRAGRGLTRPELCVLLAYAKRSLRAKVLASTVPDDPFLATELRDYFPRRLIEATGDLYLEHQLRREIVATIVTNDVVNSLGITWLSRLVAETGAETDDVVRAYWISRNVSHSVERWEEVEALFADPTIDTALQMTLMDGVDWLVESLARWYLQNAPLRDLASIVSRDEPAFVELAEQFKLLGSPEWRAERALRREALVAQGIPPAVAEAAAWHQELTYAPDVIAAARQSGRPLTEAAHDFFLLGERLHLDWLEAQLDQIPAQSQWQRWALGAIADDLHTVRREVTEKVLATGAGQSPEEALDAFLAERAAAVARLERLIATLRADGVADIAAATVAIRQLRAAVA